MVAAGIPVSVPIHITENGWPTGPTRSDERQADVLETVIRIIYEHRNQFNIMHYECFALRDADSPNPGLFCNLGCYVMTTVRNQRLSVIVNLLPSLEEKRSGE